MGIFCLQNSHGRITRRRTGELLRKLFEILINEPEGLPARVALERLASSVNLTDYEAGMYEAGGRRFEKIVRFATVDCVKAGWLLKNKGTWTVSSAGEAAWRSMPDPETFYREAVRLFRQWKAARAGVQQALSVEMPAADTEAEKNAGKTYEEAEEQAWAEIEQYLQEMNPYEFQDLVADLLRDMGYYVDWVAPPGKDSGLDIIAYGDPLGTRPPRIKVQVKRVGTKISAEILRAFMELIGDDDVGLYVSTAGFTKDAEDYARTREKRRMTLIDLERLIELWTKFEEKLSDRARQRLPLTPIYFLSPRT
jgi:restriction system protein